MQLRDYQVSILNRTREAMRLFRRVLIQAPTGAGKTALTVFMMRTAAEKGMRSWFCVHQVELLKQTSKALWKQKLEHGMIAPNRRPSLLPAQVASIPTLARRLGQYAAPDLIIIDEAHRSAASSYQKIIEAYPNAVIVGLTATPERTDGKGLGHTYETMIIGPTIRELIDAGYLCDYVLFAPPAMINLDGVRSIGGDYKADELAQAVDKATITGDAVNHYKEHALGKRCVVMCVTVEHAKHVADQYRSSGVAAECLYGDMQDADREGALSRFERGETKILTNVQLMVEGVDIPAIEVVQWLRPTKSLIVWMQANGRGFRMSDGKGKLIIFDHVGNAMIHGMPDDERGWSLEGRKARKRKASENEPEVNIQQCRRCYAVFRTGVRSCPACGAPVDYREPIEMKFVDEKLVAIERVETAKAARKEQGAARTIGALVALGMRRGLSKPAEWAAITHAARLGRKPTKEEFKMAEQLAQGLK